MAVSALLCASVCACEGATDADPTPDASLGDTGQSDTADNADTAGSTSQDTTADTAADTGPGVDTTPPPPPEPPEPGELLIEEFYYSGAAPAAGADHYFADQFIELVNTAEHPLDLSGVMLGDVFGVAGEIAPGLSPDSFRDSHPESVVFSSVWRVPAGTILPIGGRLVIAHDGTNHHPFSTVDLSSAGFETYVADSGGDEDYPTVANLEPVVFNGGFDWLVPVFGASVVVLAADAELGTVSGPFGDLPSASVDATLDAVEALMDGASEGYKRLPDSVDTGFAFVADTYVGESLHRRQNPDGTWQDTNDSSADFEVGAPDPSRVSSMPGVVDAPGIELGTGLSAFEPLTDGGAIELVAGRQGGWHFDVAARLDVEPFGVLLTYDAVDAAGSPISFETQALLDEGGVLVDGDGWVRLRDRVVLDIVDPGAIVGSTVTIRVEAELGDERWSDERSLVVVDEIE